MMNSDQMIFNNPFERNTDKCVTDKQHHLHIIN